MNKNKNKAVSKSEKKNKIINESEKKYAISLSPELADGIRFLADKSYHTQIGVLSSVLMPMLEIASTFDSFGYWVFSKSDTITIQFFGKKNQVTLINEPIDEN